MIRLRFAALSKVSSGRVLLATALHRQNCHGAECIVKLAYNSVSAPHDNLSARRELAETALDQRTHLRKHRQRIDPGHNLERRGPRKLVEFLKCRTSPDNLSTQRRRPLGTVSEGPAEASRFLTSSWPMVFPAITAARDRATRSMISSSSSLSRSASISAYRAVEIRTAAGLPRCVTMTGSSDSASSETI